jgi:hypothetical protein
MALDAQMANGTPDKVAELAHHRVCGSWRSRGRTERVHRSLENAQNAFPTATTDFFSFHSSVTRIEWYKMADTR